MESTAAWVHVELDEDGRVWDLVLDPRVSHLPLEELRAALIEAFTLAQDAMRERVLDAAQTYEMKNAPSEVAAASVSATEMAERRFAEISTALFDLSRRAGQRW